MSYERIGRSDCGGMQSVSTGRSYSEVMRRLDRLSDDALLAAVALEERDAAAFVVSER